MMNFKLSLFITLALFALLALAQQDPQAVQDNGAPIAKRDFNKKACYRKCRKLKDTQVPACIIGCKMGYMPPINAGAQIAIDGVHCHSSSVY